MTEKKQHACRYRFSIEGHLPADWIDWPTDAVMTHTYDQEGFRAITLITASLPDPPALYGLLEKLRDLNLKLIYTVREE